MPTSPVRTAARSTGSASAICVFVEIALVPRQGRNLTLAALQLSSGPAEKEKREMNREPVDAFRAAGVIVMTIVVIFAMVGYGVVKLNEVKQLDDAVKLPLLVIAGLVSLIALLAVMAIAFKTVHLANQTQALGLPDGTVRAVIALSLILIFAVVTVYLFSDLSNGDNVSCQEIADLKKLVEKSTAGPAPPSTSTTTATTNPAPPKPSNLGATTGGTPANQPGGGTATDTSATTSTAPNPATTSAAADNRRQSQLSASQDFAKQLLIMLGTLITSITSFYFASKTAEATASTKLQPPSAPPTAPVLTSVDPKDVSVSELPREFTVTGADLLDANAVSLKNKSGTVITVSQQDVLSSDTTLRFKTPIGLTSDTWTITVKKRDGGESSLADAIRVT
jgi:hypothetical protein